MATNITTTPRDGGSSASGLVTLWRRLQSLRPGDAGIAARVQMRVSKALGAEGTDIRASSVGGFVELRGTVASRQVYERAAEVANGTSGARGVLNFLTLR